MGQRVQAVERALRMLEVVAAESRPLSASDMAKRAGVNRATAWRLLNTLESFGLVERDDESARYTIGYGVAQLASAFTGERLAQRALPYLQTLAESTGGATFLEIARAGKLVVIAEARPLTQTIRVDLAGLEVPLHCGSLGKLYLASWPTNELEAFLMQPLEQLTKNTITDPARLRIEIESARDTAVAINYAEHQEEWCAVSAAARDENGRDIAYVNVTLPVFTTSRDELLDLRPVVLQTAQHLASVINTPRREASHG